MQNQCPSAKEIYDRLFVAEEKEGPVAKHFEHCTVCQSTMDGYGDDGQLRSIVADFRDNRSDFEDDSVYADTVARLADFTITEVARQKSEPTPSPRHFVQIPARKPKTGSIPFGPYAIEAVLGSGGMATVYSAQHTLLDRPTAIKILHARRLQNPSLVQRFATEVAAVAELSHPNIARAYDAGTIGGVPYLAMEFVDGPNVGRICIDDKLSLSVACEIVRQAAVGLSYAHEKGFAHRDIKPANLMLTRDGQVKIVDFGLARILKEDQYLTETNVFVGTLAFASPEQVFDSRNVNAGTDVYSLGCSLFYFLIGKSPFECRGSSLANRLAPKKMVDFSALHVRSYDESIPPALDELVAEMISPDPQSRPTALEVAARLAAWSDVTNSQSLAAGFSAGEFRQPLTASDKQFFDAAAATPVSHSRRTLLLGGLAGCSVAGSLGALAWMSQEPTHLVPPSSSTSGPLVTVHVETVPPKCPITWLRLDMGEASNGTRVVSRGGDAVDLPPGEYIIEWKRPSGERCYALRLIPTGAQQEAGMRGGWGYLKARWDDINRFFELHPLRTVGGKPPRLKQHGQLLVSDLITDKRYRRGKTPPEAAFSDASGPPTFDPGDSAATFFLDAVQLAMSVGCRLISHKELLSLELDLKKPEWTTTWHDIDSTATPMGASLRKILHPDKPRVRGRIYSSRYCFRLVRGMPTSGP